mmetsp:Transcript_1135/g.3354  ORF Transcript_1135/g.3354 Transcript_1135/m.3354 type:complete len:211 (+) Transcript_1135:169-801(+)
MDWNGVQRAQLIHRLRVTTGLGNVSGSLERSRKKIRPNMALTKLLNTTWSSSQYMNTSFYRSHPTGSQLLNSWTYSQVPSSSSASHSLFRRPSHSFSGRTQILWPSSLTTRHGLESSLQSLLDRPSHSSSGKKQRDSSDLRFQPQVKLPTIVEVQSLFFAFVSHKFSAAKQPSPFLLKPHVKFPETVSRHTFLLSPSHSSSGVKHPSDLE